MDMQNIALLAGNPCLGTALGIGMLFQLRLPLGAALAHQPQAVGQGVFQHHGLADV